MMHFEELKNVMEKYDLIDKPHLIFNIDEQGITINHSPPRVVTGSEIHPQAVTSGKSSTITILACGNAIGNSIPPYLVLLVMLHEIYGHQITVLFGFEH
jgi:hypothetical protein